MELVQATADDWERAWEIQRAAFLELVTRTYGGWTDEQVRKCADAWDPSTTRMVVEGREVAGWVRVKRHPDHDWLDLIVVAPSRQGRGLGERVLGRLLAEARARGVPLRLSVYRTNPARRLYARMGLVEQPRDELRVLMVSPGP